MNFKTIKRNWSELKDNQKKDIFTQFGFSKKRESEYVEVLIVTTTKKVPVFFLDLPRAKSKLISIYFKTCVDYELK